MKKWALATWTAIMSAVKKWVWTTWTAFILALIGGILIAYFSLPTNGFNFGGAINHDIADHYGSFIGGLVGPIFSLAGIFLLYETIKTQQDNFKIQQFENRFFELIRYHRENVQQIVHRIPSESNEINVSGIPFFVEAFKQFDKIFRKVKSQPTLSDLKEKDLIEISYSVFYYGVSLEAKTTLVNALKHHGEEKITKLIDEFRKDKTQYDKEIVYYGGHINRLGHYFRHLAKVAEFVEKADFLTSEDKEEYFRLFRAQLTHYELIIFFVSNFIEIGKGWEKSGIISRYKLMKSLPEEISDGIKPKKYYNIEYDWEKYSTS